LNEFQFHSGSIKTEDTPLTPFTKIEFQFHSGLIKT